MIQPTPPSEEILDLDALIARYGVERARARPKIVGIIGGLWSWFLGLSLAAKILVGIVAIAGLMYVARLLQRPSFDLQVPRTYGFNARRNTSGLGLHIPILYGEHRNFPPIINQYIDAQNDKEYLYTLYAISEGPIERISDVEVNEQPIERYQEVSWQARLGTPDQEAIPWFQDTRNTYAVGVELLDDGRSFIYRTLRRVDRFLVRVKIPPAGGAASIGTASVSITVRVEHRREGESSWTALPDVVITANTRKPVSRQIDSGDLGQVARAYAGTVQNDSSLAGTAWSNPTNAQGAPNDTWASVNEPTSTPRDTQYLRTSGHGFAVPGGATITGIELRVERHHVPEGVSDPPNDWLPEGPFSTFDRSVRLAKAGTVVGEDKAVTGTAWPLTDTVRVYGGPGDLWGEAWTPSDVNDGGFGAALAARVDQGTCRVDAMELRVYYTLAGADLARREIRVTRVSTSTSDKPPLSFDSVDEILYGSDLNRYANVAVLGVKIQASEQLSGEPKISALVRGRKVRPIINGAFDPTEVWTRNPVDCLADLLTHPRYGLGRGGLTDEHLVLPSFQAAKDYCDEFIERDDGLLEIRHELDVVIDEKTIWEWCQDLIPNVFRGGLVESDGRYRLFFDHLTPMSQVFTDANIIRGTFETSWLSISEQYDQVELFYLDRDQYYFRDSVLFPATGTKRKVIEGRGITRRAHATREARYHHHLTSLLARSVQFDASIDAIACDVGDVIGVSHTLPHSGDPTSPWAYSGRVAAVATADSGANHVITVDRGDLPTQGLDGFGLLLRLQDDTIEVKDTILSVSAPYTSSEGYPRQDVKVSGLFAATPAVRDSLWAFGPVAEGPTKLFRVLALTLNTNRTRKVTAFEYREFADEAQTVPIYEPEWASPNAARIVFQAPNTLFAYTTDHGETWDDNTPGTSPITSFWPDHIETGLLWTINPSTNKLRRSTDGGETWADVGNAAPVNIAYSTGTAGVYYALCRTSTGRIIAAAATASGVRRVCTTDDKGQTWTTRTVFNGSGDAGIDKHSMWVVPSLTGPETLYLWMRSDGLFRSEDDGATWVRVYNVVAFADAPPFFSNPGLITSFMVTRAGTLLLIHSFPRDVNDSAFRVRRSTDRGDSWATVHTATFFPTHFDANFFRYRARMAQAPTGLISIMGRRHSTDDGLTWATSANPPTPIGVTGNGMGATSRYIWYGGTDSGTLWRSEDGLTWAADPSVPAGSMEALWPVIPQFAP